ncbi:MAG: hypothetical protein QGH73_05495 [Rhodospirillales bacterium]|jgi:hypothetical protein|nr:hypothetical protein [Rhodospirillaceae bacterium]MDP6428821.1 hypothetical protein [Rhodospirillales bacterium]MDP6643988.1 hypothetical protein [Rhodospirillales bacterium]MDP6841113.1 hypothetical protein [Rhodospirillales bacterium]|tara:strand:- start:863 stop:1675 length:813 start_codon:yes stop_codon:yes gene_type:complete
MLGSLRKKRAQAANSRTLPEPNDIDGDVDLENGIIVVDDSAPEETVATSEIFREAPDGSDVPDKTKAGSGKVFILDMGPIFKALGVARKDRIGHSLVRFCDNLMARAVAGNGTYDSQGSDMFFFKLNMSDDDALRAAVNIVNQAGTHFLRGGFKAEDLIPQMIDAVNEAEAMGADGGIDPKRALGAQARRRRTAEDERLAKAARVLMPETKAPEHDPEWEVNSQTARPAGMRVKRGPQRRSSQPIPFTGTDRRTVPYGRRQSDNPKIQSW